MLYSSILLYFIKHVVFRHIIGVLFTYVGYYAAK